MIGWLAPGGGDPADYRVPVMIAAAFVLIPAAMVPVMGFGAIATSSHGAGWMLIAGALATLGFLGTAAIVAGAAAAASARVRPPVPALLVAGGTTLALAAGILLVPVLMAGLATA